MLTGTSFGLCDVFFVFNQKTAYELRISDWSSDVCSSDLLSRRSGLYKSTALRLLESLRKFSYVSVTGGGRYELGPTVLRLGRVYQQNSRLQEKLLPVFQQIVAAGSESPSFFIRQGRDERPCVFPPASNHSTLDRVKTGLGLPPHPGRSEGRRVGEECVRTC